MSPPQVFVALDLRQARIGRDVPDHRRLAGLQRVCRKAEVTEWIRRADVLLVDPVGIDAGHATEALAVDHVDVAVGRIGGVAEPVRHTQEDGIQIERGAELQPGLHQQAEHAVGGLQALEEQRVVDRAGDDLRGAHEKVAILVVVALAMVVDVEQADHPFVGHERHDDLASRAGLPVQVALVIRKTRIVRRGDDEDLATVQGVARAGKLVEIERTPHVVFLVLAVLVGQQAGQRVVLDGEHLAAVGSHDVDDTGAKHSDEAVEVAGGGDELAELHELGKREVAPLELLHEERVLDGACRHLAHALQKVEKLAVVARLCVEDVYEADDLLRGEQRDAQLALKTERRVIVSLAVGQPRVVETGDDHRLAAADRHRRRGELVHVDGFAHDAFVEAVRIGARHAAERLAL